MKKITEQKFEMLRMKERELQEEEKHARVRKQEETRRMQLMISKDRMAKREQE